MKPPLLGIVFHSDELKLRRCLASVETAGAKIAVVVLDVSPTGIGKQVVDEFDASWMDGSRNAGYAWGLHMIADEYLTEGQVFIGSNADVEFLGEALFTLAENTKSLQGVCYPLQLNADRQVASYNVHTQLSWRTVLAQYCGIGRKSLRRWTMQVAYLSSDLGKPVKLPPGLYGSGAVFAVTYAHWRESGGFDRRFFLYSEDKSFGTTLNRLGIPAYLCGDAHVVHEAGTLMRGVAAGPVIEALVSEQLNWAKFKRAPVGILLGVQIAAFTARLLISTILRRDQDRAAYAAVVGFRMSHLSIEAAAPRAADGRRLPAYRPKGTSDDH